MPGHVRHEKGDEPRSVLKHDVCLQALGQVLVISSRNNKLFLVFRHCTHPQGPPCSSFFNNSSYPLEFVVGGRPAREKKKKCFLFPLFFSFS